MLMLNQTKFADLMGWHKSYVTELKKSGRLVITESGKVDVEASKIRISETADPNRDDVVERHEEERSKDSVAEEIGKPKAAKQKKEPKPHDPNQLSFSEGRAKEQKYKALQAELEYNKSIGDLVPKKDMQMAVVDMVTTFRMALENLPHLIAADLVGKDINLIRSRLKQEVHAVLANLERECNTKIQSVAADSL